MPHRTLTTKPPPRALLDQQLFALSETPEVSAPNSRGEPNRPGARLFWLAVALSLILHGGMVLLCWFQPLGDRGLVAIDTRVSESLAADADPDIDFFITFPEPDRPPKPAPPKSQPVAANITPPVVFASRPEAPARSTAPLNPLFNQRLAQGESTPAKESGSGESGERPGGGENGATSFFQIPARGQRIVYVIDRSSSMGETGALALAKRELRASLERLIPEARFQVIAYNRAAEPLRLNGQGGLLPATPDNKRQAVRRIDALRAEGATEHLTALKRALLLQPDVLFLLTDADALTEEQVRIITRFNQGRTVIHALEVGPSYATDTLTPLQLLARENRGTYRGMKQTAATSFRLSPPPGTEDENCPHEPIQK
jgi:hypothetical protein